MFSSATSKLPFGKFKERMGPNMHEKNKQNKKSFCNYKYNQMWI